ncbi:MAG: hypothetical protein JOY71_20425 [Acetobacteraceae bacterium]|nr:hypothetical protein [Acetobacteraceae bacterium]
MLFGYRSSIRTTSRTIRPPAAVARHHQTELIVPHRLTITLIGQDDLLALEFWGDFGERQHRRIAIAGSHNIVWRRGTAVGVNRLCALKQGP